MSRKDFYRPGEERQEPYLYRACGLDGIYLLNGYSVEEHDGEEHVFVQDEDMLHRAIGLHLATERKALSGKEVRFLRNTLDLTQSELAKALGTTSQTVARWEKGVCEIPGSAEKLLRMVFIFSQMPREKLTEVVDKIEKLLLQLNELDDVDEVCPPRAGFFLKDGWHERQLLSA